MEHAYDDGGRAQAGYKGTTDDCVTRAIAIAAELPYQEVYDALFSLRWATALRGAASAGGSMTVTLASWAGRGCRPCISVAAAAYTYAPKSYPPDV